MTWTATAVDLVFGSNSELRTGGASASGVAKSEVVRDVVAGWVGS